MVESNKNELAFNWQFPDAFDGQEGLETTLQLDEDLNIRKDLLLRYYIPGRSVRLSRIPGFIELV